MATKLKLFVEALGADAVARAPEKGFPDVLLAPPDGVEMQPFVSDLEAVAPGAAADAHLALAGRPQDPRQVEDTASVGRYLLRARRRFRRPSHQVVVARHVGGTSQANRELRGLGPSRASASIGAGSGVFRGARAGLLS
jgi:hypothetical protein